MAYDVMCKVDRYSGVLGLVVPGEIAEGLRLGDGVKAIGWHKCRLGDYVLYNDDWLKGEIERQEQLRGA
jgi:hypothetical protein